MKLQIEFIQLSDSAMMYLRLRGDLLLGSCGELRDVLKAFTDDEYCAVWIDMVDVHKVDAAGLGTLVAARAAGLRTGTRVALCNLPQRTRDLLVLTRLLTLYEGALQKAA